MMSAMLAAGALAVLAGLGAIAWGIPVKEFSVGNTLILSGTLGVCSGLLMLGLAAVLAELKVISQRLRTRGPADAEIRPLQLPGVNKPDLDAPAMPPAEDAWREGVTPRARPRMPDLSAPLSSAPIPASPMSAGPLSSLSAPPPLASPLRPSEPERTLGGPETEASERPKRNLLFASSSRRDRERADKRGSEPFASDFRQPPPTEPPAEPLEAPAPPEPAPGFDDGWQRSERPRAAEAPRPPFPRRFARAAPAFVEPEPEPAPEPEIAPAEAPAAISIIKSGVVDGMAYSLYSDGSIEAQMPEGMMRFASIDELRTHLEGRG
ncbi:MULTISPECIES: hypothetical protein [Bradyrhizobium]|jgi:hypothetical protein|uniref:DUF308 domain-containing protein n=2 Tax=Bradyrhizobium TaxID=374 RepID=A0ABS5G5B0_9BRAD|nr:MULTISPECIES: hypothetical protein [Bradyrhizobium]RTM04839.1 MAG: hypothetical protein EKK32_04880 [Bradyrhizobiaceae bacterium]MBR1136375.1 hypothetical protein [Bradyrhizobium denitrificans]MDU1492818.1 hypothetical protein [Bradyrhizobium sp.]MDU1543058.1 hypothetical protein [Bradyrhizobium sp.]MDU1666285.1 hypothetical protein [Bradyrhizobium sp.]